MTQPASGLNQPKRKILKQMSKYCLIIDDMKTTVHVPEETASQIAFDKGFCCALTCAQTFLKAGRDGGEIVSELERLASQYPAAEPVTMPHPALPGYRCAVADFLQATRGGNETYALYIRRDGQRIQVGQWSLNPAGKPSFNLTG
jgi:hypothetical protein